MSDNKAENIEKNAGRPKKKAKKNPDILVGARAVCNYIARSESTLMDLIRRASFPCVKEGHIWISSKKKVDEWRSKELEKDKNKRAPSF